TCPRAASSAVRAAWWSRVVSCQGTSCFGLPSRVDAPAARITTTIGASAPVMDGALPVAQRPAGAAGEHGPHFGGDGQRDLGSRLRAEVEADGGVQPAQRRGGDLLAAGAQFVQQPVG